MTRSPAWFPSAEQELLLRAALLEGEPAERAWVEWRGRHEDEQFDPASFRLLPLVYRNLSALGSDDPWMGRLKGLYRRSWFLNQSLFTRAAGALERLEAADIPTLLLKGAGLSAAHYRDLGVRPMDDVDMAVPRERAGDALAVLAAAGLHPTRLVGAEHLSVAHAETLVDEAGNHIDLHWSVMWRAGPDEELWQAAVPVELRGVATRTLCATDHVLQTCAHGAYWNQIHPLRWVSDVAAILRSPDEIDWERLVRLAERRELTLPVGDALGYMQERFAAPVPADLRDRLRAQPVRALRRASYRVERLPPSPLRSAGLMVVYLDVYRSGARALGRRPRVAEFVASVQRHLEVDGVRQLALRIGRSFLRRAPRPGAGPVMARRAARPPERVATPPAPRR